MKLAKKITVAFAIIAGMVFVTVLIYLAGTGSELKRYKAGLRAKGEKLTYKELAIAPSTNADEVAALKILAGYSTNYSLLSSSVFPSTMAYVAPGKARVGWRGELRSEAGGGQTAVEWKTLESDNLRAAAALAQIRAALLVSPPDSGWIYNDDYTNAIGRPSTNYVRDRTIAQALQRDLMGELHRGNLDAALNDLHALAGQTGVNRNELTLVSQMIRVAITGLALNSTWEALQAPDWDEPRLASLQKDWEQVQFLDGIERALLAQRAFFQVVMNKARHSSGKQFADIVNPSILSGTGSPARAGLSPISPKALWTEHLDPMLYRMMGANEDELLQMQHTTALVELARQVKASRPWPEINLASSNLINELDRRMTEDHFHRLRVSAIAIPNFTRVFATTAHAETLRRLTVTAIALKRYQLKHGAPPSDLAVLTPEFLTTVPIDPMSGKALCYRLKADGTFVLYSTGEDGKDDGGDATPREADGKFGLWEGRDAVWPAAATEEEEKAAEVAAIKK
jgi:hypothetical protein